MTIKKTPVAGKIEIWAWAMFDFANSGYTTVVLTAVFNAYFVSTIYHSTGSNDGAATFYWSVTMAIANLLVLLTAPVIGAVVDVRANKKRWLAASTVGCVVFTASLSLVGPGDLVMAMILVVLATIMFGTGENLIAAFLPEISRVETMGRISGFGWSLGYIGGMLVLGICLVYVQVAQATGATAEEFVPGTMLITAAAFALAALPTFIWLQERARPLSSLATGSAAFRHTLPAALSRLWSTLKRIRSYRDLFVLLLSIAFYSCGVNTVITLAAIYATQVFAFETADTIVMIIVVNITAAIGAFAFGILQDRIGSKRALVLSLLTWITAVVVAYLSQERSGFWIAANLVGIAMGSSQSAGRALVGQFSPKEKAGEFFGLWGLSIKLAAIVGPLSYGLITLWTGGRHRTAILSTLCFFIIGLALLLLVDEKRGRQAAKEPLRNGVNSG